MSSYVQADKNPSWDRKARYLRARARPMLNQPAFILRIVSHESALPRPSAQQILSAEDFHCLTHCHLRYSELPLELLERRDLLTRLPVTRLNPLPDHGGHPDIERYAAANVGSR